MPMCVFPKRTLGDERRCENRPVCGFAVTSLAPGTVLGMEWGSLMAPQRLRTRSSAVSSLHALGRGLPSVPPFLPL